MRKCDRVVLAFAFVLAAAVCCAGTVFADEGLVRGTLRSSGMDRAWFVHLPPHYDGKREFPLVLALHGGAGRGDRMEAMTGLMPIADREGFILVYPNGTGELGDRLLTWNSWNCCGYAHAHGVDDVRFFRELLARLKAGYRVDPRRVFVTGLSNGGMLAYRLGCELADHIAAIAPVAGALNGACSPVGPVSVIIFHGTEDQHVRFAGGKPGKSVDPHPRIDNSVASAVSFWVRRDGCQAAPVTDVARDSKVTVYGECRRGTEVVLYAVQGQGHAWPGGTRGTRLADEPSTETQASELMWAFFKAHPRQ